MCSNSHHNILLQTDAVATANVLLNIELALPIWSVTTQIPFHPPFMGLHVGPFVCLRNPWYRQQSLHFMEIKQFNHHWGSPMSTTTMATPGEQLDAQRQPCICTVHLFTHLVIDRVDWYWGVHMGWIRTSTDLTVGLESVQVKHQRIPRNFVSFLTEKTFELRNMHMIRTVKFVETQCVNCMVIAIIHICHHKGTRPHFCVLYCSLSLPFLIGRVWIFYPINIRVQFAICQQLQMVSPVSGVLKSRWAK